MKDGLRKHLAACEVLQLSRARGASVGRSRHGSGQTDIRPRYEIALTRGLGGAEGI